MLLGANQFHDNKKAEAFLNTEEYVLSQTTIGQATGGFGASQATAYKVNRCKMIEQSERTDASVCAAKIKRKLEKVLVGAKVKTVPVGILGTPDNAKIRLIVTGPDTEAAMALPN
jgi:HAE1 family hydrophobic/amphiphilic exporter-1